MIEFQNLQSQPAVAKMTQTEFEALLGVQRQYLGEIIGGSRYGTCILDGQPYQAEVQCICRYNLPDGRYCRQFFGLHDRSSDRMAEDSIDEILRYTDHQSRFYRRAKRASGLLETGIYRDGELIVMVLNADNGTFYFAPNLSIDGTASAYDLDYGLIYATAEALAIIGREDRVLQASVAKLLQSSANIEDADLAVPATVAVRRYFGHDTKVAEIRTWREWRNRSGYHKKARVFFE